jgi:hypothetical protein
MTLPVGATRFNTVTDQYEVYDNVNNTWVAATSTPDVSTVQMPNDFQVVFEQAGPGTVAALKAAQNPNERWTDTFAKIATNLGLGVQQYQLMNLNVQRARQGLPPIDVAAYAGAGVNVGLSAGTQQLVTYAGLALIGLVLLNMATKK